MTANTPAIEIEDQDVRAAQSAMITQLLNENLQLRAALNKVQRDKAATTNVDSASE